MSSKKKDSYVKPRHRFYFSFLRPVGWFLAKKYHYKTKPMRLKKGEQYLILSNHQSLLDPVFVAYAFKAPVYFLANDSMISNNLASRLLVHCFAPIKKRKSAIDIGCIRTARQVAKEGGNIALFPEGNRTWYDYPFYIDNAICKMIRLLKLPVVLFNLMGGYGVNPRWGDTVRKGEFRGVVKKILSWDEIQAMSDEELLKEVRQNLRVVDSESGKLYKSKAKAEFLERLLFVCPKCHSLATLHSHGNSVTCSHCGLKVNYGENLRLSSDDGELPFETVLDWHKFQQETVKNYPVEKGITILEDDCVEVFDNATQDQVLVAKGKITLSSEKLTLGHLEIPTAEITNSSAVSGRKLYLNTTENCYLVVGGERFNPVKYLLFFNILCENIAKTGGDKYYGLSITDVDG